MGRWERNLGEAEEQEEVGAVGRTSTVAASLHYQKMMEARLEVPLGLAARRLW